MAAVEAREVKWGRHRIRLLPGWDAEFRHSVADEEGTRRRKREGRGPAELAHLRQPAQTPDGRLLDATDGNHPFSLDREFSVYEENIDTARDAARAIAAAALAATFHEVIEWVTVDGHRLADPHPEGDPQWEWTMERMFDLLADYAKAWPNEVRR